MVHTAYSTSIKKDNWERKFCEELRLSYLTITANKTNGESWLPSNSFVCVCGGGGGKRVQSFARKEKFVSVKNAVF